MNDKDEPEETNPFESIIESSNVLEEQQPEPVEVTYDTVPKDEELIESIEGTNEESVVDLLTKDLEVLEVSASKDTIITLEKRRPISILSNRPKKKNADTLSKKSISSKGSMLSKLGKVARDSKETTVGRISKIGKGSKGGILSTKSVRQSGSRTSSLSRQSNTSSYIKPSIQRMSSLSRPSRISRVSVTLSSDSNLDARIVDIRKVKKSTDNLIKAKHDRREPDSFRSEADIQEEMSEVSFEYDSEVAEDEAINMRNKMLSIFKDLPDINDLSDISLHPLIQPQVTIQEVAQKHHGSFVPGVSSFDDFSETPSSESVEKNDLQKTSSESSFVSKTTTIGSDDTLLNLPSLSLSDNPDLFILTDDRTESFSHDIARKLTEVKVRSSQVDFLDAEARELHKATKSMCQQFVYEIIGRVVTKCEEESAKLMRWLDKNKMWKSIMLLLEQLNDESLIREKLERLTTEHFLRKKRFVFIRSPKHFDTINYNRLRSALLEFDRQLMIEFKTNEKVANSMRDLEKELQEQLSFSEEKLEQFESIVRQTLLLNDSFTHLKDTVDKVLANMAWTRNELSEMRLELLFAQHRFAEMMNKLEELEDLGYGLRMHDYLSRQADTQILALKIEERNAELTRLHRKKNYDVHALAHLKCKEHMCRRTQNFMQAKLASCIQSKNYYRSQIYQGKLKHNAFVREIYKLKTDGSLLDYPVLLLDYDKTVEEVRVKRESVEKLRNTHKHLMYRISSTELMLKSSRTSERTLRESVKVSIMGESLKVTQLKVA